MKHIKTWQERVNEGDSIYAKATALEAEVNELREYVEELRTCLNQALDRSMQARREWIVSVDPGHPAGDKTIKEPLVSLSGARIWPNGKGGE